MDPREKALEIAKKYEGLSMQDKIGIIAQTFGCTSDVEVNAGFEIIAKVQVGPVEYALGERGGKFPSFVTWERTPANDKDSSPNYYWGHYFESREEAVNDFCQRAEDKFRQLHPDRKPSIKAQLATAAKPAPSDKPSTKAKNQRER